MKALIVDDEKIIVDGIKLLIEKSGYIFESVYTVYSASQAIDILREEKIDILFSDIKMPAVDGFALIERAAEYGMPETILITGFAEFEYVQKAINAGVLGYILKPIEEEQFYELLKRAVNKVLSENTTEKKIDKGDLVSQRREKLLERAICGEGISESDMAHLEQDFGISEPNYMLITFHLKVDNELGIDLDIVIDNVKSAAKEYFSKKAEDNVKFFFFCSDNAKKIQCLCVGVENAERIETICERFCREYSFCVPVNMCISISDVRKKLSRELYTHSQEAYYERCLGNVSSVLKYKASSLQMVSGIENDLKVVDIAICNDDMIGLRAILDRMLSADYITESGLTVRAVYFLIANTVILTFNRLNAEIMTNTVDELLSEKPLKSMESIDELAEYVYNTVFDVLVQQKQYKGTKMTVVKIINYVDTNFDKDLSVKQLSMQFGLTPNYLSQIFKKATEENFATYLNKLRVGKACELLRNSNIKIYEVCRMVGYKDSQYFYRVFKKYIGQTPIEYRMNDN